GPCLIRVSLVERPPAMRTFEVLEAAAEDAEHLVGTANAPDTVEALDAGDHSGTMGGLSGVPGSSGAGASPEPGPASRDAGTPGRSEPSRIMRLTDTAEDGPG